MSIRDIKRSSRRSLHSDMSVPALYLFGSNEPLPINVRVWTKSDPKLIGDLPGLAIQGAAAAEIEDHIRFDLAELTPLRHGVVSVEAGEAYRIDHLYPADLEWQTARVLKLSASEASGLPLPEST